eukprot:30389-Pelagococcus_subviridis.AAC.3
MRASTSIHPADALPFSPPPPRGAYGATSKPARSELLGATVRMELSVWSPSPDAASEDASASVSASRRR